MFVQNLFLIVVAVLIGLALLASLCLRSPFHQTSLSGTWKWGVAAEIAWFLSVLLTAVTTAGSPLLDQVWLWTAILTLCPLISVLGARRPGNRVWGMFVILPLLLVLGWPAFTVMVFWPELVPLKVQAPVFAGFLLVLVMGVGNFIGTRYTFSAISAGVAAFLSVLPLSTLIQISPENRAMLHGTAGLIWAVSLFYAMWQRLRPTIAEDGFDRLWFDFRDTFGIVWARRIQDRLNETAEREAWTCRLGPNGFEWDLQALQSQQAETQRKMDHALRWHLRRFVDPEWIDQRLGAQTVG